MAALQELIIDPEQIRVHKILGQSDALASDLILRVGDVDRLGASVLAHDGDAYRDVAAVDAEGVRLTRDRCWLGVRGVS